MEEKKQAKENLHIAASIAGVAITNSCTGIVHSYDHPGPAFSISHGNICGLMLPYLLKYVGPHSSYSKIARRLGNKGTDSELLLALQNYLFDCGSDLSTPHGVYPYKVDESLIKWIEERIDTYADIPPALERFILPGGDEIASMVHVARTIARRAERHIVATMWTNEINNQALIFVNRLSDYFFALARVINYRKHCEDIPYERGAKVFHNITKADVERWAKKNNN